MIIFRILVTQSSPELLNSTLQNGSGKEDMMENELQSGRWVFCHGS